MANRMKNLGMRMLDGIRQSVSNAPKTECDIEESLRSEHFQVSKTVVHGFPFQPTSMAFDPVQHFLAIGTKSGSLRIFGRPGVDCYVRHDGDPAVIQILVLVNEGALITVCSDDQLHLWNLRQKRPEIIHSLKFQRERITHCHQPFQSKWLYIGTEKGNVHVANIDSFELSGYVINWNKAIELSRKTHPGQVIHLSDNPVDPNKLLIGFESGAIVLWDLKAKAAEHRYNYNQALRSVCWNHEGKQFVCSHTDGSLTTWNVKLPQKPAVVQLPHAKTGKDGNTDPCSAIMKVDWKSVRNSEPYVIFSGGMPYDRKMRTPCLTVVHGKSTTVLEMEHTIIDFITLCSSPWDNDFQDPYAIVVLLENDLVVVDLTTPGYPCFENPYPMDIHESPVTACQYYAKCPTNLIPAFYSVGARQKKSGFSDKEWPMKGGTWGSTTCSYPEIIITGHADGSLKFWDASSVTLQVLYKLKTAKLFEKPRKNLENSDYDEDPFAIQHVMMCTDSRLLCVAGYTHAMLFKFCKQEAPSDCACLEISIVYELYDELDSPELEYPPIPKPSIGTVAQQSGSVGSYSSNTSEGKTQENVTTLRVKQSSRKWPTGYQPYMCCLLTWHENEPPPPITSIQFNSKYGLLAFGNECGLAVVDFIQKTCLLNMGTPDLYGSMDPYVRVPRSPKNKQQAKSGDGSMQSNDECKSPTSDQSHAASGQPLSPSRGKSVSKFPALESITESHTDQSHAPSQGSQTQLASERRSPVDGGDRMSPSEQQDLAVPIVNVTEPSFDLAEEADEDMMIQYMTQLSKSSNEEDVQVDASPIPIRRTSSDGTSVPQKVFGDYDWSKKKGRKAQSEKVRRSKPDEDDESEHTKHRSEENLSQMSNKHEHNNNNDEKVQEQSDATEKPKSRGMLRKMSKKIKKTFLSKPEGDPTPMSPTEENHDSPELTDPEQEPNPNSSGFMRKMSKKVRQSLHKEDQPDKTRCHALDDKFYMIDLTSDDVNEEPITRRLTYVTHALFDKNDGSFSRSRSSSMSSLENVSKEAIQCLVFADSYTRKQEAFTCPCLWVGTSLGSVLVIVLNLPPEGEQRKTQPVIVSPSGTIFRLKGTILGMSFLDCNGVLIPALSDQWRDEGREEKKMPSSTGSRQTSVSSMRARMSPTQSTEVSDRQFAIICSEKHARVISLPSQACTYKVKITDTSFVAKAEIVEFKDSVCLACYVANGHIVIFSLPSLKPLMDNNYLPLADVRIAKTFTFSNSGHALFFCSPTELQKITFSQDMCDNLDEMLGDLIIQCETPEAPKISFFKNLFAPSSVGLDREQLFGEESGKASKSVAKYTPGSSMADVGRSSGMATSEIGRAKQAALERGEKLGELQDVTEKMRDNAENYSKSAHTIMQKYKDKKWYQF